MIDLSHAIVLPLALPPSTPWVICLCADWCGLCRDYRQLLERVAASRPDLRFAWIDIEDEAGLIGELDIVTFPTLLIADEEAVQFLGPLTPHAETLTRLLASLREPGGRRLTHDETTRSMVAALPGLPALWISPLKTALVKNP